MVNDHEKAASAAGRSAVETTRPAMALAPVRGILKGVSHHHAHRAALRIPHAHAVVQTRRRPAGRICRRRATEESARDHRDLPRADARRVFQPLPDASGSIRRIRRTSSHARRKSGAAGWTCGWVWRASSCRGYLDWIEKLHGQGGVPPRARLGALPDARVRGRLFQRLVAGFSAHFTSGTLADAAETGLYDTLSHPGPRQKHEPAEWNLPRIMDDIRRALDRIAKAGTAMELNTSGRVQDDPRDEPRPGNPARDARARHPGRDRGRRTPAQTDGRPVSRRHWRRCGRRVTTR